jgi:methyl-accepting chemotaxis protein
MVGDISKAIREQGVASTNIARQVESIAQMSEENCAIAQSIAHAAQEMAQVSHTMQDTVRKFKV